MLLLLSSLVLVTGFQIFLQHTIFNIIPLLCARLYFASRFIGGSSRIIYVRNLEIAHCAIYAFWWVVFYRFDEWYKFLGYVALSALMLLIMWYDDYSYLQIVVDAKDAEDL